MLKSAAELMEPFLTLESRIPWVKCPFCDDEVSKLRPCLYWNPGEQKSNVCVECAETAKGLTYIAASYPAFGIDVRPELMPMYQRLHPKYITESSYKAYVTYGDLSFMVWKEGTSLAVLEERESPDLKKNYNNTFQVWFAIKNIIEKGSTKIDETKFKKGGWKKKK